MIINTPLLDHLKLKIGARISLTYNVRLIDGLVNGAMGKIIGFERNGEGDIEVIIVQFDDEKVGKMQRQQHPIIGQRYKQLNGTPIFRHVHEYFVSSTKSGKSHAAKAKVAQFPLTLAWAFTCHKMQVKMLSITNAYSKRLSKFYIKTNL